MPDVPRQIRDLATDLCVKMFRMGRPGGRRSLVVSSQSLQRCVEGVEDYLLDLTPPDEAIGKVSSATGQRFDKVKRVLDRAKRRVIV